MPEDITHNPDDAQLREVEADFFARPDHATSHQRDFDEEVEQALYLGNSHERRTHINWQKKEIDVVTDEVVEYYRMYVERLGSAGQVTDNDRLIVDNIRAALRGDKATTEVSSGAMDRLLITFDNLHDRLEEMDQVDQRSWILGCVNDFPRDCLAEAYAREDESPDKPLHNLLSRVDPYIRRDRKTAVQIANKCYGGCLLVDGYPEKNEDPAIDHLLSAYEHPAYIAIDLLPYQMNFKENISANLELTTELVADVFDLLKSPNSMKRRYMDAINGRLQKEDGSINTDQLRDELKSTIELAREIGPEWVRRLHEELYVDNIWMHSMQEINIMRDILAKDEETIEYLRKGDVTVVFVDSNGDHNGAFMNNKYFKRTFGQRDDRSLTFEIPANPIGVYRIGIMLNKLGIYPNKVVFGVHGLTGESHVGSGDSKTIFHTNETKPDYVKRAVSGSEVKLSTTQIGRFISDFTRPSKHADDDGEVSVILVSCYGSAPVKNHYGQIASLSVAEEVASQLEPGASVYASAKKTNVGSLPDDSVLLYDVDAMMPSDNNLNLALINATDKLTPTETVVGIGRRNGRIQRRVIRQRVRGIPGNHKVRV